MTVGYHPRYERRKIKVLRCHGNGTGTATDNKKNTIISQMLRIATWFNSVIQHGI